MSRHRTGFALAILLSAEVAAHAQEPPQRIDILADPVPSDAQARADARCLREQQDASLRGEIVVCAPPQDQSQYRTLPPDEAQKRYARETMYANDPQAPDVAGPGIFRGQGTVSGLCLIPPCPPPPVLLIDLEAIPEAPAGSDAERVGQGLAPRGEDD